VYFGGGKELVGIATPVLAMLGDQYRTFEFYYEASPCFTTWTTATTGSISRIDPGFPNDELLRLTIEFLTGSGDSRTMTVDWVTLIQIRD